VFQPLEDLFQAGAFFAELGGAVVFAEQVEDAAQVVGDLLGAVLGRLDVGQRLQVAVLDRLDDLVDLAADLDGLGLLQGLLQDGGALAVFLLGAGLEALFQFKERLAELAETAGEDLFPQGQVAFEFVRLLVQAGAGFGLRRLLGLTGQGARQG